MTTRRNATIRYTAGPVTFEQRSLIHELQDKGLGVTAIRNTLRERGMGVRNQTLTDIVRESRDAATKSQAVRRFTSGTPSAKLVAKTQLSFATQYMYHGIADLTVFPDGRRFTRDLQFGSNELLTAGRIRGRFASIVVKGFADKPVLFASDADDMEDAADGVYSYYVVINSIVITHILESTAPHDP